MKLPLLISLASASVILHSSLTAKRTVGPCEPYAEICRHCTDCSQCRHCSIDKGKCSVCFKK